MPRIARLLINDQPTVYHVISRTYLPGYPLGPVEKEHLVSLIKQFSRIYFTEVLGFCIMGNHFHLLVRMLPAETPSDAEVLERYRLIHGKSTLPTETQLAACRRKWSSLSEYVREIKQRFSRYYNKMYGRRGFFWGERFKSVIVENGRTLINCLAYIDLNPIRANIAERPEDYRWSSIGYHMQSGNKDDFLSTDFGLLEWDIDDQAERVRLYREFLYATGALDAGKGKQLDERIVERAREKKFKYTRADRFAMRTRYFTDSAILGTKEFVAQAGLKLGMHNAANRTPKHVTGLSDLYSFRRLTELL